MHKNIEVAGNEKDRLARLFTMQAALNDFVFNKNTITDNAGSLLRMHTLVDLAREPREEIDLTATGLTNEWIGKFLQALQAESKELGDELKFKWWSSAEINLDAIRVEIIDILHFWISMALVSGMDDNDVFETYIKKYEINIQRQVNGYAPANS